ncbi:MAG: BrnT family toxin [Candidatus Schekmanbacteria bacterium]|nr:BrnT family toxin [Candidatus Schekmanbacteria bacterium]
MRIEIIIWLERVVDKLSFKHNVTIHEVEEALSNQPKFRLVEKGQTEGENIYLALGQSVAQRYLVVFFIYKRTKEAIILSARDMVPGERKQYERK